MRDRLRKKGLILGLLLGLALTGSAWASNSELSPVAERVRHALVTLPYYTVFDNLEFRVDGSKVTLLGKVVRPTLKKSAESVVKRLEEVTEVDNRIEVLPVSPNDDRIRRDAYISIYGNPHFTTRYAVRAVPPIHIIVDRGDLTLEGVVANQADKDFAGILARGVSGAFSVTNNLRVEKEE